jgi:hypothetical protein
LPARRWRLEKHFPKRYFNAVGRIYLFECSLCHYRTKVAGGATIGIHCEVQTVACRDCRELFDVFTRIRQRESVGPKWADKFLGFNQAEIPPVVLLGAATNLGWQTFPLACPVNAQHFVEPWQDPGRCPRCGNFMEKNGFPFRSWD